MKINKNLEKLNVDFPPWTLVDEYLQSDELKDNLLEFLSVGFSSSVAFRDQEKLMSHAFRILSFCGEKKVLPYLVECMRLYRPVEVGHPEQIHENKQDKILLFQPKNRISDNLLLSCKHSLDLLAVDPKMGEVFWTLYETTLDKEIGLEFLGSALQANVALLGRDIELRKLSKVKSKLITALKENFFFDPFFSAYHAMMTLDVKFIPYLERVIREGLDEGQLDVIGQSELEDVDELFILLGQIPVSWFVLNELKANRLESIAEHIKLFLHEDPYQDFMDFYMKGIPIGQRDLESQVSFQKDCEFRAKLKSAFLKKFVHLNRGRKKVASVFQNKYIEEQPNNVIELFRH